MALRQRIEATWERVEPWAAAVAFVAGFAWDASTLTRVDRLADNLMVLAYGLVLAVGIVLDHRVEVGPERMPWLTRHRAWVAYAVQFCLGGLCSAVVIFHVRSAWWGPPLLFVLLVGGLMVVNEARSALLARLEIRLAVFGLLTFATMRWMVTVATGWTGHVAVLASAALALVATAFVGAVAQPTAWRRHGALAAALSVAVLLADALGWVPEAPLAVVAFDIAHDVQRVPTPDGPRPYGVQLTLEHPRWRPWVRDDRTFHWAEGEAVHAFTAVFAPTGVAVDLVHHWERWDDDAGWETTDRIRVSPKDGAKGGADGGWRTWSRKARVSPGAWRVTVETAEGRIIARRGLRIVPETRRLETHTRIVW